MSYYILMFDAAHIDNGWLIDWLPPSSISWSALSQRHSVQNKFWRLSPTLKFEASLPFRAFSSNPQSKWLISGRAFTLSVVNGIIITVHAIVIMVTPAVPQDQMLGVQIIKPQTTAKATLPVCGTTLMVLWGVSNPQDGRIQLKKVLRKQRHAPYQRVLSQQSLHVASCWLAWCAHCVLCAIAGGKWQRPRV